MSTPQLDRLQAHCQRLRLYHVAAELPTLLEHAAKQERSYTDFLEEVLSREVHAKGEKHLAMRLAMARFPFQKTLESFDFKFQPSIDVKVLRELATGRYLSQGENILLLGPPDVGKTHLAVALGIKACEQGQRVLFTTAMALLATLNKALLEHRLDERLKLLVQPQLLIIDESATSPLIATGPICSSSSSRAAMRRAPSCSPATKAWQPGAMSSAIPSLPPPSWIACSIIQ
jgi:DNA replication protein DnaC